LGFSSQFENNYFTEMCSGSEAGSYLRCIDFVYHPTLGLRVIKKRRRSLGFRVQGFGLRVGVRWYGNIAQMITTCHAASTTHTSHYLRILVYLVIYDSG